MAGIAGKQNLALFARVNPILVALFIAHLNELPLGSLMLSRMLVNATMAAELGKASAFQPDQHMPFCCTALTTAAAG